MPCQNNSSCLTELSVQLEYIFFVLSRCWCDQKYQPVCWIQKQHGLSLISNPFPSILPEEILTTAAHQLRGLSKGKGLTAGECSVFFSGRLRAAHILCLIFLASALLCLPVWGSDPNLQSHQQVLISLVLAEHRYLHCSWRAASSECPGQRTLGWRQMALAEGLHYWVISSRRSHTQQSWTIKPCLFSKVTWFPCGMFHSSFCSIFFFFNFSIRNLELRLLRFIYNPEWANLLSLKSTCTIFF